MKKFAFIPFFVCVMQIAAQKVYVFPTTAVAPRGSYQTITAVVNDVNDKTVTWSTSGGTLVGTNPCVVNEPCTIALYTTTAGAYKVTATSNANHAVVASSAITYTDSPSPASDHPRFIVTPSMLSTLRAKATSRNKIYQANLSIAESYFASDNAIWSWTCKGGTGLPSSPQYSGKENDAGVFAYMALVDPDDHTYNWGCYAHDIYTYVITNVLSGKEFFAGNIWADGVVAFTLTPDWLIGAGHFTGGSGATATATLADGTLNIPALTAGGTGYTTGTIPVYAPVGTSGCTPLGSYYGVTAAALGTATVDASGVVTGLTITRNASGCTTAPSIHFYTDQQLARLFFAYAGKQIIGFAYGYAPPINTYNSSAQFATGTPQDLQKMRAMGNNYTFARLMYMIAIGLTFDDNATDDPPLPNTCGATRYQICPDYTAGSLHAYWKYADGAMLYMYWAHLEDPSVTWQAYRSAYSNLATRPTCLYIDGTKHPCFGDGRGGESSEGSWYQYSIFKLRWALNMLHTAGMDDPILYGPQMSLETSSWWDLKYVTDLEFLTAMNVRNGGEGPNGGQPAFGYLNTGDTHNYYRIPNDTLTEASILTFDSYTGRTDRSSALRWIILNSAIGGPLGTFPGCVFHCGFDANLADVYYGGSVAQDLMISQPAGDPVSSLPADPRPSLPTDLYNGSLNQHQMVRSGWGSNYTLLSTYAPNALIDHEHEFAGRFDIFANGEYITKGRTEFTNYLDYMTESVSSNTMSLLNTNSMGNACTAFECVYGGQFSHMDQAGLNSFLHSELPAYSAAITNMPLDYNGFWNWSSPYDVPGYSYVTGASRSLVYLRGTNQVVFYDRGATGSALDKSIYQVTTGTPTISGNVVSWPTQSGNQKAYFTSLLPASSAISNYGLPCPGCSAGDTQVQSADWEPVGTIKVDAGNTASSQFLSVLEWGTSSLAKSTTSLVQSTAGQNFDGSLVGSSLVMFMRTWPATFTSVTYPASGATTQYISDLSPDTTYSISGAGAPTSATTDTAGVLSFSAAGTGNITILAAAKSGQTARIRTVALCAAAACAASIVLSSRAERVSR